MTARLPLVGLLIALFGATASASAVDERLRTRALILKAEDERDFHAAILRSALASEDAGLRSRALLAFGRIGDARAVPLVTKRLADRLPAVRREAAFALGEIGSPAAFDSLRAALLTEDGELAGLAAEALAKIDWGDSPLKALAGRLVVEALLAEKPACPGADPASMRRALEVAWRFGADTPGLVDALIRLDARGERLRVNLPEAVVYCAARLRDPRLGELLARAAASSPIPLARSQGARGLGALAARGGEEHRSANVRKILVDLARTETTFHQPSVDERGDEILVSFRAVAATGARVNALRALRSFPAPEDADDAHAALAPALSSTDHHLQREALALAGAWKVELALPAIRGLLEQADRPDLQVDALAALVAIAPPESRGAIEDFASSKSWRLRAAAADALGVEGLGASPESSPILDALLLDDDARVVAPATNSAVAAQREDAVVLVLAQLGSRDSVVRAIAASHLPSLVGPEITVGEAAQVLRAVRRDARGESPADARLVALDALVELLGRGARADVAAALQDPDFTVRLAGRRQARALGLEALAASPVGPAVSGRPLDFYLEAARGAVAGGTVPLHLVTSRGVVDIDLDPAAAPLTVRRLLELARAGWFDGISFHRVVPDFVVQGGCPRGDGWGGPEASMRCEINHLRYERGAVGMALSGKDTGGSQFFFTLAPQPHLDGGYTIFGRVRSDSMEVVDRLRRFDTILAAIPGADLAESEGDAW